MRRPTRCYRSPLARPLACGAWLLVVPRVFRAPEGPAAREARRPHFVRRCASKPARALRSLRRPPHQWGVVADVARCIVSKPGQVPPPPTGTAAWPCGPSGALHTSGAGSLIGASSRSPARPRHRPRAPQSGPVGQVRGCLKPSSPLRARARVGLKPLSPLRVPVEPRLKPLSPLRVPAEPRLKPPSPLRVRNGRFWRVFRAQRRCRFQGSPVGGEQWCWWFQCRHLVAPLARKSSPCVV